MTAMVELARKILTTDAMMSPIRSMMSIRPMPDKSFLTKNPTSDIAPNVPAVIMNVLAMLSAVYAMNINDIVTPLSIEYAAKHNAAVRNAMRMMRAERYTTSAISAIIMPQKSILFVKSIVSSSAFLATVMAVNAVISSPAHIHAYTLRMSFANTLSETADCCVLV